MFFVQVVYSVPLHALTNFNWNVLLLFSPSGNLLSLIAITIDEGFL